MAKFRTIPTVVDAIQFTGDVSVLETFGNKINYHWNDSTGTNYVLLEESKTSNVKVKENDWIVRDADGFLHILKPAEFNKKYEAICE